MAGDVVDGLVGIELDGLAAGVGQRVDDVGLDLEQAEFEHLEQADGAGTDDDGVGLDRALVGLGGLDHVAWRKFHAQRINSDSLPVRSFHSSASGCGSLRLVMLFQLGSRPEFGIECGHVQLVFGQVFLGEDGADRALGDADGTVDALVRIDGQEVRAFAEAVDRADVDAVGVFAADAGFGDDVGHGVRKERSGLGF
jgi:hypothetical protein